MVEKMHSTKYYAEMDIFKTLYKKEYTGAKKDVLVEENDAQPITGSPFRLMCK